MDYFVPYFLGIAHSCINLDVMEEEKSFAYSRVASCILGGLESFFYFESLLEALIRGKLTDFHFSISTTGHGV